MKDHALITKVLKMAAANGYKCYEHNDGYYHYGFLITPNNNILYIQGGDYGYGVRFSLQYKPSAKTGSGCSCNDDAITEVNIKTLEKLEKAGLNFARRLKATLYNTPDEWLDNYWDRDNLKEVTND